MPWRKRQFLTEKEDGGGCLNSTLFKKSEGGFLSLLLSA